MSADVTYTCVLDTDRSTVEYPSRLLAARRCELGTRAGTRALVPFKQAVLMIRWFLDGTRPVQLATDNKIGTSTVYAYPHEGIDALTAQGPDLEQALDRALRAGARHLNLDGTVVRTDRICAPDPNSADPWWSGRHKHHGGNIQVLSGPDRWPLWTCGCAPGASTTPPVPGPRPTCLPALEKTATEEDLLTLTDLGYENLSTAMGHPVKKPAGRELTIEHKAYNQLIRGVHGIAERVNSLLKTTFKALRRVSLDPWRIGAITRAGLVLLQLEHGRTTCPMIIQSHQPLPGKAQCRM